MKERATSKVLGMRTSYNRGGIGRLGRFLVGVILAALLASPLAALARSASGMLTEADLEAGTVGEAVWFELEPETAEEQTTAAADAAKADAANADAANADAAKADTAQQEALNGPTEDKKALAKESEIDSLDLTMANVHNILNVRSDPNEEADKVGYLYADCGGKILERKNGWTKIRSGKVEGWASDEYLLFGEAAWDAIRKNGRTMATVTGETLRIRKEPSIDAEVLDLAAQGQKFEVVDAAELQYSDGIVLDAEWAAVDYEGDTGYISAEYVDISLEYDEGETIEQVKAREEAEKKAAAAAAAAKKKTSSTTGGKTTKGSAVASNVDDLTLLAALIQCEAGNQPYDGQVGVGAVVVNRLKSGSYPNTMHGVIYASGQFSPAGNGKVASVIASGKIKSTCVQAAQQALAGVTTVGGATHFRRAGNHDGLVIGNHVFW